MARIILGGVVRDEDFYVHEKLVATLWRCLETSSVLLVAPRRTGKSSVMQKLLDEQSAHRGFVVQYKNCQIAPKLWRVC